jgi:hypothetical protein
MPASDPRDPSTWAIRPGVDSTVDVSDVALSDEDCSVIACILDRARARRALCGHREGGAVE